MNTDGLLEKAKKVLLENLYEVELNGRLYRRTVPSRDFYIHQWNWDSATHAMGLVHVDEQRARDELTALTSGQWDNGLVAQITFNPNETKYFPGPQFWGTEKFAVGEIMTSGISQPPLLGVSFSYVFRNSKNKKNAEKFAEEVLPKVIKYHDYLKNYRDSEDSGLLTVVHPWESGTDNAPRWDEPLAKINLEDVPGEVKAIVNKYRSDDKAGDPKHRPGLEDYYKYMFLVHLYKEWAWDYRKIIKDSPFLVKDVLFNSIWCWANDLLSQLLNELGKDKDADRLNSYAESTRDALKKMWNQQKSIFTDLSISGGISDTLDEDTIATFSPLLAQAVDQDKLEILLQKLSDPDSYWTEAPVPTTPLNSPKFELAKYWRGPTWPITNLFIIEGLAKYRSNKKANEMFKNLIKRTLRMITENGFYEYFDPTSGSARPDKKETALGFGTFSWTAAIALYLLNEYKTLLEATF